MKRYLITESSLTAIGDAIRNKTGSDQLLTPKGMASRIMSIKVHEGDPVLEGLTITPDGTEIVKVPPYGADGFGIVTVLGDDYLLPENIKQGVTIYGVEGDYFEESIDTSDATATAADILEGASAYVDGVKIEGTHVCDPEAILAPVIVTPTGIEFVQTPEEGVNGFSEVTVLGDEYLLPENIKQGVTIYGVEGEMPELKLQNVSVKPGIEDQTVKPEENYNGLGSVTIEGDANLLPENIKSGETIFGVTGTYSSGDPSEPSDNYPFIVGDVAVLEGIILTADIIFENSIVLTPKTA